VETNDFYKGLLEELHEGVYFVDNNRKITYWNKAAERITGYLAREVEGTHCYDNLLVHVDDNGNNLCTGLCPLAMTIKTSDKFAGKVYLHHKDGHRVPVNIKTIPMQNPETGIVEGGVEVFTDEKFPEEIEKKLIELEKLASKDELCGIANRRFMKEKIKMLIDLNQHYDMTFGLVFVDIDHFKRINDTYSHDTGDKVLKMVSNTMLSNTRDTDLVARWGGEEFVAVFPEIPPDIFKKVVERLRFLIEKSFISERQTGGKADEDPILISVTASMGATLVQKGDGVDSIVERADKLMYLSKNNGRNQITFDF